MFRLLKLSIFLAILLQLLSCTPAAPYEVKSPCVSADSNDLFNININPCVRRPVNALVDIV